MARSTDDGIHGFGLLILLTITLLIVSEPAISASAFALQFNPASLTFSAPAGSNIPSTQTLTIWKRSTSTRNWGASATVSWLSVTPSSGSISTERDTVQVMVNPSGLSAGLYSTSLIITTTSTNGSIRKTAVPVSVTVTSASNTGFTISPPSLTYTSAVTGPNQVAGVTITNTGSSPLTVTWFDSINWLVATSGDTVSMPPGGSAVITHTASTAGLSAGTYTGAATITGGGITKQVPISMTVTANTASPVIGYTPTALSFSGTVGGGNPASKTITVSNTGGGTLSWTASDNAAWLIVSPASGTNSGTITASVNLSGLAAGTYNAAVTLSTAGAATKTVPVTLTVSATPVAPAIGFSPTSLSFTGTAGGVNPVAQTIAITNTGGGTLPWTASDNAAWLTVSPAAGTNSGAIIASVNLSGLAAGTYSAIVTLSASGASTKTVPVALTVSAAAVSATLGLSPSSLTFSGTVGGANPAGKPLTITNTGSSTLTWTASDNAAWLTVSPASGTSSGTIAASVNLSGLTAGTYNAAITITATGATNSPRTIPVTLTLSAATAGTATLVWNANNESDLAGYRIYRGTSSGTYGAPIATLGKATASYVALGLQTGTTYFFVITAYDSAGNESPFSNEVSKSIF